jgi:hypothetical protein
MAGHRRLELAGQVRVARIPDEAALDLLQGRRPVDDLVLGDAGDGGAEERPRRVAARLGGAQSDGFESLPDRRDVLDADPVVLDVLPVGDVGGVPGVGGGDLAERAELLGPEKGAVGADPHHEELVVQLVRLQGGGLATVEAGRALGVEPQPAHPAAQVVGVDGGEATLGVDVLDARPHVQRVVVLLELLVGVQRLSVAECPLALSALRPGPGGARGAARRAVPSGAGHGRRSLVERRTCADSSPTPLSRHAGDRTPGCWSRALSPPGRAARSGRHTDHAAGTPEVHVATGHEVLGGRCTDHGRQSRLSDSVTPNAGLMP